MKHILIILVLTIGILQSNAQKTNSNFRYKIQKTNELIVIDGVLNEQVWNSSDVAKDFFMVLPEDKDLAKEQSEIRMTYNDKYIYLSAVFFKSSKDNFVVESLRRDFSFGKNDNFLIFIDPFNNLTTGFSFGTNAAGAQWDGTMHSGGNVDLNWDSKWISKVVQSNEKWVFEMALPFKSIRYKDGVKEWGINFSRLDLTESEKSSWTPIPKQFPTASLAYTGILEWDTPPPSQGTNLSIIPYVLGEFKKESLNKDSYFKDKVGGDVKIGLTSSLNLDLTVNPDFSHVEVDKQVTNLDRYELFFPEKRQFFLENGDLFANFGYPTIRPFFSRRIGLGVPIDAGARISGNLNEKWRIGIMDMQTSSLESEGLPKQNFGVITLQRKVFSRSSLGLMFVDKESFSYPNEQDEYKLKYPKYNRNLGFEYNLASSNNLWTGKAFFLKSFGSNDSGNGNTHAAHLEYKTHKWNWRILEESVSENYSAEVGFVPRNSYVKLSTMIGHLFFPKKGKLLSHGPKLSVEHFFNRDMNKTDNSNAFDYSLNFRNRSSFKLGFLNEFVELLNEFDPTRSNQSTLEIGSKHNWNAWTMVYNSKPQGMFTYNVSTRFGGYYEGGKRFQALSELGYRFQPYISLSSTISYNHLELSAPWNTTKFWLIGSTADITFSNKLFFKTLFQYNEQSKNFNFNSQFQWRYKPASDVFVVYSNNHLLEPYEGKNWALTIKMTYWFNK